MNQHVGDLIGLYALGALSDSERDELESHLKTCARCSSELREAEEVLSALPLALEPVAPSPNLRERVLHSIQTVSNEEPASVGEPQTDSSSEPLHLVSQQPTRRSTKSPAIFRYRVPSLLAVAAVLALLIGVAVGRFSSTPSKLAAQQRYEQLLGRAVSSGDTLTQMSPTTKNMKADAAVAVTPSDRAFLIVGPTTPAPRGHVYQIWFLNTLSGAHSAGVVSPGLTTVQELRLRGRSKNYRLSAITVEPGPRGSSKPTSKAVMVGKLRHV